MRNEHHESRHGSRLYALALVPTIAAANTVVPGTLIWFATGGMRTSAAFLGWLGISMAVCISVEWAVYRYTKKFRRPLLASIVSNFISLSAGLPLAVFSIVDPTWFLLPTLISIIVEYWSIIAIRRLVLSRDLERVPLAPVFWGNIVSNLMIFSLLIVSTLKHQYGVLDFW